MRPPAHCQILLEGLVGSQAYGLATASSDQDWLGIFVPPTSDFWGLDNPAETYTKSPGGEGDDYTFHEAKKYVKLALKCNPTVLELLYLDFYTVTTDFGNTLRDRRESFLSRPYVRNAYLGYATAQFSRIKARIANKDYKADAKNARHLWRLLRQGTELYTKGTLNIKLSNPQACRIFGEEVAEGNYSWAQAEIATATEIFDSFADVSPLPDRPDTGRVESWLMQLRSRMIVPERGLDFE